MSTDPLDAGSTGQMGLFIKALPDVAFRPAAAGAQIPGDVIPGQIVASLDQVCNGIANAARTGIVIGGRDLPHIDVGNQVGDLLSALIPDDLPGLVGAG